MTTEVYNALNAVRFLDLKILRLCSKKVMLESCLYPSGIRYDLDKVQASPDNPLEKIAAQISDVEVLIRKLISAKITKAAELEQLINKTSSEDIQTVLYLRYVSCQKVEDIASSMSYSKDWVYKKIRIGADEIGRILKEEQSA
jgi:hypothetical protein